MARMATMRPRGGGTITIDRPTKESDTTRNLWYVGWLLSIRALAVMLLAAEIILVGPWAGPLLIAGSLWYGTEAFGFWLGHKHAPKFDFRFRDGIFRQVTWVVGTILGYVLTLAAVTGYWLPVEWVVQDGLLWLTTAWGNTPVFPKLYTIPVWVRWGLIIGMPWITWRPFSLLHWVFEAESTFKNLREISFQPADPGTIDTPLGKVRTAAPEKTPAPEAPESSAPLQSAPSGQVKILTQTAQHAPTVDLV